MVLHGWSTDWLQKWLWVYACFMVNVLCNCICYVGLLYTRNHLIWICVETQKMSLKTPQWGCWLHLCREGWQTSTSQKSDMDGRNPGFVRLKSWYVATSILQECTTQSLVIAECSQMGLLLVLSVVNVEVLPVTTTKAQNQEVGDWNGSSFYSHLTETLSSSFYQVANCADLPVLSWVIKHKDSFDMLSNNFMKPSISAVSTWLISRHCFFHLCDTIRLVGVGVQPCFCSACVIPFCVEHKSGITVE